MTAHATRSTALATPTLKPLMLAILTAFPLYSAAQVAIVPVNRPAAPAAFVVPRPMPGWRVSGSGAAAPVNVTNRAGGTDQSINQTSQRGIYSWQTFDVGVASSVTFNFPSAESSALNRVAGSSGSAAPSQIFGALKSQYIDSRAGANGAAVIGGSVYLVNANGILFGRSAQVNVGALIASTLNLGDADFLSGLTNSIAGGAPSFKYDGAPELFTDANNFVRVDAGAQLTTASGGRVFLFAKNVQNAGAIATPGGQTVLGGGAEIYLGDPSKEPIYASEVNESFPALRGLLVEVGKGAGTVTNLASGLIDSPRGNTTLVGMAVNQAGRISATTSVASNGSVLLLARGAAIADPTNDNVKRATVSGALTLGAGSRIDIGADTTLGADGLPVTSDGASAFTRSRVELAGQTIELQAGAAIVAPGGSVNLRAEVAPNYAVDAVRKGLFNDTTGAATARLVVGDGAVIDVSGTTSTQVSVARNFVTTELLGKSDLKDAPLQKDGPLYRSKVTFDLRSAVPMLGDTSSYQSAVKRSATEQLASGGSVALASTGTLVTHQNSRLNVSGGAVTYLEATVMPTRLVGADGTRYTLNQAPVDVVYSAIEGGAKPSQDRWGNTPQYTPAQASTGRTELGYVAGAAAGSLSLYAPTVVLDGALTAATTVGRRQLAGSDARAATGRIEIGTRTSGAAFGARDFHSAGVGDLDITRRPQALSADYWAAPLDTANAALASHDHHHSRIAADTLSASGAGKVIVTTDGSIRQSADADITLAPSASLDLGAAGAGGIELGASFRAVGGNFTARSIDLPSAARHGATVSGPLSLAAGRVIDVAGNWSNAYLDGVNAAPAVAGGSVSLTAAHGLNLQDSSRIDVSGGANVRASGVVVGTAAGSITLESNNVLNTATAVASIVHIGAVLKGQSLVGGGTLRLKAADLTIGSQAIPRGVSDGVKSGALRLSDAFFRNGGFTSYDIAAVRSLSVLRGTTLIPQTSNWIATASARNRATGTRPSSFLEEGQLPASTRRAASLSLSANAAFSAAAAGDLTLEAGSAVLLDPLGSLNLRAGLNLRVDGSVVAPGGAINLALVSAFQSTLPVQGTLRLGAAGLLDVAGTVVLQETNGAPALSSPRGKLLAGGSVSITSIAPATAGTAIELLAGSSINADGASARLQVDAVTADGTTVSRLQTVRSAGGSVSITASDGGTALAGSMHAWGGSAGGSAGSAGSNPGLAAAAGKFSLTLNATAPDPRAPRPGDLAERAIKVQDRAVTAAVAVRGVALVSAQTLSAGFADVTLASADRITFSTSTQLAMARQLVLNAPVVQLASGSQVVLSAGSNIQLGAAPDISVATPQPSTGNAALTLKSGLVEWFGSSTLQGLSSFKVDAASELRLHGALSDGVSSGSLATLASVTLNAAQIVPTTGTAFTLNAPGQRVLIGAISGSSAADAAVPMSAGGSVTINAADIEQNGVLRAPFGRIDLVASRSISLGVSSVTSVSGLGLNVPYGATSGDANWVYNGRPLTAPLEKTVNLLAPGQRIEVKPGAVLDLAGGGDLLALEFVPGPGGSKDQFLTSGNAASSSFAVLPTVTGYAPQDHDLQAIGVSTAALGRQITFGANGPVPAGTYAVLPARYGVLTGAFLVTPVTTSTAAFELGANVAKADGSFVVGAKVGFAGAAATSVAASFKVMSALVAGRSSEIHQTSANAYFAQQALAAGTPLARLPFDAGRLNLVADALTLKGRYDFSHPSDALARGGELDIAAARIRVVGTQTDLTNASTTATGVLTLQAADLNTTGAALLVLGGTRGTRDAGSAATLNVAASSVVLDNGADALKVADLVLVATGRVELMAGAQVQSTGAATSPALTLIGDGALLRLSGDAHASTLRTQVTRANGDLVIGAGVVLNAASLTAEGTHSARIAPDASLHASGQLTLGANRMAIGAADAATLGATTLLLTPSLLSQLGQTDVLALRSFDGINFYGAATLGAPGLQALTLDTGALRMVGTTAAAASATVLAGGVTLANTTGGAAAVSGSSTGSSTQLSTSAGQLVIEARGGAASTGQVVIGPGSMAVAGAATVAIKALHEVVLTGNAEFSASGDLRIDSAALVATQAANAALRAGGRVVMGAGAGVGVGAGVGASSAASGAGAHVVIGAQGIELLGKVVLPSGELSLQADAAVALRAGSLIDLAGRSALFDGRTVATPGGDLRVSARAGEVSFAAGSVVDVSAPAGATDIAGSAGSVTIAAPLGAVTLAGRLRATAALEQGGGALSVDSANALDLAALARMIDAERNATRSNFAQSLDLRNRIGDQAVTAGVALRAHQLSLSSDAGSLTVVGSLDAGTTGAASITGAAGAAVAPSITLAAGQSLVIATSAQLLAHASGVAPATVELMAHQIVLSGGVIDVSATAGGTAGRVLLRAAVTDSGSDVRIGGGAGIAGTSTSAGAIATRISGAQRVEVEAVRRYAASVVDTDLIARIEADNDALVGPAGASAAIRQRLAGSNRALLGALQLRAGVEVVSTGDLRVEGDLGIAGDGAGGGWNLTRFDDSGVALTGARAAPMNLTLRAAGTLNVAASLSDGFAPAGDYVPDSALLARQITPAAVIAAGAATGTAAGTAASIRLVGGADLSAANVMAVLAPTALTSAGDVNIGAATQDVLVRTTTGRVQIAAGRDVKLVNRSAVVYTTGTPVVAGAAGELAGYVGDNTDMAQAYLVTGETIQSPFLQHGGAVTVAAGRDLVGANVGAHVNKAQYATEWLWAAGDLGDTRGAPLWRSRYDQFQQGFATFGGGAVTASAGRDALGVELSAATSGYVARVAGYAADLHVFGGGAVSLLAQRDVLGGFVLAGQGAQTVRAGRDVAALTASGSASTSSVTAPANAAALQVVYGATQTQITARNSVDVARVASFGLVGTTAQVFDAPPLIAITGVTAGASLAMQADAGDLRLRSSTAMPSGHRVIVGDQLRVIPDQALFAAPAGSITLGKIIQAPVASAQLAVLAAGSITAAGISVSGATVAQQQPLLLTNTDDVVALGQAFAGAHGLGASAPLPVQLVALAGDIDYAGPLSVAGALRVIAGRDILASGGGQSTVQIQHLDASGLSLLQAGRDLLLPQYGNTVGEDLKLHGPGQLVVVAGRHVDLRTSGGIGTLGNREIAQLPAGSATLTVLAGVKPGPGSRDFVQATAWYFPLLGGTGIAGYAPDLAAQLDALQRGAVLPALGSQAASDFNALTPAARIARAQALAGAAGFDAALLTFGRRHEASATLDLATARTRFEAYAPAEQDRVIAASLASAWAAQLPQAQQLAQVLAMADQQGAARSHAAALAAFVQTSPAGASVGRSAADPATALQAFAALPIERQLVFISQVLSAEVRSAGRAASALTGAPRDAAYALAYAAIDVVFPEFAGAAGAAGGAVGAAAVGNVNLGSSQLRTFQGSNIDILTPRGGINVGQLTAQSAAKGAGSLGIVTAAGGAIELIVRDSVAVNQSRVFTVGQGDLLMWASEGNLDAGRGAKTVTGAPPPVFKFDANGNFVIDTSGSFSGSGIAVLDASSTLDLYAPKGEINAGDAGIKSLGNAFLGAARFVGADNLAIGGVAVGAPPPAPGGGDTAGLASVGQASTSAGTRINADDSDDEKARKRRKRMNLILDFLGFGDGAAS